MATRTRLKSKRLWRGMTQQQVADAAGVNRAIVQQWEAQTHVPNAEQAIRVAKVMNLDFEDLFHDFQMRRAEHEPPPQRGRPRREEQYIA